ncbi:hypothetical protein ACI79C_14125 [Geodermatophilus sp. SYSU D00697]
MSETTETTETTYAAAVPPDSTTKDGSTAPEDAAAPKKRRAPREPATRKADLAGDAGAGDATGTTAREEPPAPEALAGEAATGYAPREAAEPSPDRRRHVAEVLDSGGSLDGGGNAVDELLRAREELPAEDVLLGLPPGERYGKPSGGHGKPRPRPSWEDMPRPTQRLDGDLLAIRRPVGELDVLADRALEAVRAKCALDQDGERDLREAIVELGLAGEVSAVTRRLNQLQLSDARRRVLAVSYPFFLKELIEPPEELVRHIRSMVASDDRFEELVARRRREVQEMFEDPAGVVAEVRARLEQDGGPLHVFADALVQGVERRKRLLVEQEGETGRREYLVARVRAAL